MEQTLHEKVSFRVEDFLFHRVQKRARENWVHGRVSAARSNAHLAHWMLNLGRCGHSGNLERLDRKSLRG